MPEAIRSVMLAGNGLLRWPGGEERVHYRVNVGFDSTINGIHVGPPVPDVLLRPGRHGGLFLCMPRAGGSH